MKKYSIFLAISIILTCLTSEARWAKESDAEVEYDYSNIQVRVHKNGSFEEIYEGKYKILTEDARDAQNYQLSYNGYSEKLEILEAYTINDGKKYKVDPDFIVDKAVSSVGQGFDEIRKVTISFAKVERNSQIYLKYKRTCFKPAIEDFFDTMFYYSGNYYKSSKMRVVSDLPLNIVSNDPKNSLKISHVRERETGLDKLEIDLVKPIIEYTMGYDRGILDIKHTTYVTVSSEKKWENLSARLASPYYKVASQDLPVLFQDIFEAANKIEKDVDKINKVTSGVNEKIRYMGDWRTVKGQFFPNDLNRISDLQTGDCKDFSAVTGAILKKLGYKVQFALVWRGDYYKSFEERLPVLFNINHVILKVTNKNGRVFWIDPTNFASMADGIFPDIEDKTVLILEKKGGKLEKIPKIDKNHAVVTRIQEIKILNDDAEVKTKTSYKGEEAKFFTGMRLNLSEESIKERIFYWINGFSMSQADQAEVIIPNLNSVIVKDLELETNCKDKNLLTHSNLGRVFSILPQHIITEIFTCDSNQIRDFHLGSAHTSEKIYVFKNIKIKNLKIINFNTKNKWFNFERIASYQGEDTVIKTKLILNGGVIKSEELKTHEFLDSQAKLEKNVRNFVVILD